MTAEPGTEPAAGCQATMARWRLPMLAVMSVGFLAHAEAPGELADGDPELETPLECRAAPDLAPELNQAFGKLRRVMWCADVQARPLVALCRQKRCDVSLLFERTQRLRVPNTEGRVEVCLARSFDGHRCDDTFLLPRPLTRFEVTARHAGLRVRLRLRRVPQLSVYVRDPSGRWFCDRPVLVGDDAVQFIDVPLGSLSTGSWAVFVGTSETWFVGEAFGLVASDLPAAVELSVIPEPVRDAG